MKILFSIVLLMFMGTLGALPIRSETVGGVTVRLEIRPFSLPVSMIGEQAKVDAIADEYMVVTYTGATVAEAKGYEKFKQAEQGFQQEVKKRHGKDVKEFKLGKSKWKDGKVDTP